MGLIGFGIGCMGSEGLQGVVLPDGLAARVSCRTGPLRVGRPLRGLYTFLG